MRRRVLPLPRLSPATRASRSASSNSPDVTMRLSPLVSHSQPSLGLEFVQGSSRDISQHSQYPTESSSASVPHNPRLQALFGVSNLIETSAMELQSLNSFIERMSNRERRVSTILQDIKEIIDLQKKNS